MKSMHRNWWFRSVLPSESFDGALCARPDVDPEYWTADTDSMDAKSLRYVRRKAVEQCSQCVCNQQCLLYALRHPELQGIWGGTDEAQRKEMRAMYQVMV